MVRLFVVIVVLCRLRAGAPQPPDCVAGRHQPREAVPSHSRERYTRILSSRSTSNPRITRSPQTRAPLTHALLKNTIRITGNRKGTKEHSTSVRMGISFLRLLSTVSVT
ncbi:unnamed protein product [Parnassius apollo]|uniref:(apollo) hypothetical protein n=1 Tax=Parnassius apollo TaxID=110799 RepID=A0A8S3Y9R9_PARAO|nr:unnamed protein product [Parnassius apollo]